jgi:hypothetical protein
MSSLPFRRLLPALLLSLSGAACSDASPGSAQPPLAVPLGCAQASYGEHGFTPCNIVEQSCQQRIAAIAACQWGGPGTPVVQPAVLILSQDDYRAQLRQGATRDEAALALRSAVDASLGLFGLIEDGDLSLDAVVERNVEDVLAFYDPPSKSITVIDRSAGTDQLEANATLLHEMIHALQDTAHDLDGLRERSGSGSSDGDVALRSLVEGEAKLHDLLFSASASGELLTPEMLQRRLEQRRRLAEDVLFQGSSVLSSSLQSLPYLYGPEWALERWLEGGSEALRLAYDELPAQLLAVLQSSWGAAWQPVTPRPYPAPNVYTTGGEPEPDSEVIPLAYDRLGAYAVYAMARLAGDTAAGQELALGWHGDQLDVYELDVGGAAARWHVSFVSTQQAATFADLLAHAPGVSVRQEDVSVVAVVSESGSKPEWLFGSAAR